MAAPNGKPTINVSDGDTSIVKRQRSVINIDWCLDNNVFTEVISLQRSDGSETIASVKSKDEQLIGIQKATVPVPTIPEKPLEVTKVAAQSNILASAKDLQPAAKPDTVIKSDAEKVDAKAQDIKKEEKVKKSSAASDIIQKSTQPKKVTPDAKKQLSSTDSKKKKKKKRSATPLSRKSSKISFGENEYAEIINIPDEQLDAAGRLLKQNIKDLVQGAATSDEVKQKVASSLAAESSNVETEELKRKMKRLLKFGANEYAQIIGSPLTSSAKGSPVVDAAQADKARKSIGFGANEYAQIIATPDSSSEDSSEIRRKTDAGQQNKLTGKPVVAPGAVVVEEPVSPVGPGLPVSQAPGPQGAYETAGTGIPLLHEAPSISGAASPVIEETLGAEYMDSQMDHGEKSPGKQIVLEDKDSPASGAQSPVSDNHIHGPPLNILREAPPGKIVLPLPASPETHSPPISPKSGMAAESVKVVTKDPRLPVAAKKANRPVKLPSPSSEDDSVGPDNVHAGFKEKVLIPAKKAEQKVPKLETISPPAAKAQTVDAGVANKDNIKESIKGEKKQRDKILTDVESTSSSSENEEQIIKIKRAEKPAMKPAKHIHADDQNKIDDSKNVAKEVSDAVKAHDVHESTKHAHDDPLHHLPSDTKTENITNLQKRKKIIDIPESLSSSSSESDEDLVKVEKSKKLIKKSLPLDRLTDGSTLQSPNRVDDQKRQTDVIREKDSRTHTTKQEPQAESFLETTALKKDVKKVPAVERLDSDNRAERSLPLRTDTCSRRLGKDHTGISTSSSSESDEDVVKSACIKKRVKKAPAHESVIEDSHLIDQSALREGKKLVRKSKPLENDESTIERSHITNRSALREEKKLVRKSKPLENDESTVERSELKIQTKDKKKVEPLEKYSVNESFQEKEQKETIIETTSKTQPKVRKSSQRLSTSSENEENISKIAVEKKRAQSRLPLEEFSDDSKLQDLVRDDLKHYNDDYKKRELIPVDVDTHVEDIDDFSFDSLSEDEKYVKKERMHRKSLDRQEEKRGKPSPLPRATRHLKAAKKMIDLSEKSMEKRIKDERRRSIDKSSVTDDDKESTDVKMSMHEKEEIVSKILRKSFPDIPLEDEKKDSTDTRRKSSKRFVAEPESRKLEESLPGMEFEESFTKDSGIEQKVVDKVAYQKHSKITVRSDAERASSTERQGLRRDKERRDGRPGELVKTGSRKSRSSHRRKHTRRELCPSLLCFKTPSSRSKRQLSATGCCPSSKCKGRSPSKHRTQDANVCCCCNMFPCVCAASCFSGLMPLRKDEDPTEISNAVFGSVVSEFTLSGRKSQCELRNSDK